MRDINRNTKIIKTSGSGAKFVSVLRNLKTHRILPLYLFLVETDAEPVKVRLIKGDHAIPRGMGVVGKLGLIVDFDRR